MFLPSVCFISGVKLLFKLFLPLFGKLVRHPTDVSLCVYVRNQIVSKSSWRHLINDL